MIRTRTFAAVLLAGTLISLGGCAGSPTAPAADAAVQAGKGPVKSSGYIAAGTRQDDGNNATTPQEP